MAYYRNCWFYPYNAVSYFLIVDRIRTSIKNRVYMPDLDVKTEVKQIKEKKKLKKEREQTVTERQ